MPIKFSCLFPDSRLRSGVSRDDWFYTGCEENAPAGGAVHSLWCRLEKDASFEGTTNLYRPSFLIYFFSSRRKIKVPR